MDLFSEVADYRDYLKAYYEKRKKGMPFYSYRMMGDKLGLDSSHLYRILQKKQHLPAHALEAAKELLGIFGRAAEYFNLLYSSNVSKDPAQKAEQMAKAVSLRDVERRSLQNAELRFLENANIPVVRAWLEINGGVSDARQIAGSLIPPITESEAKEAVQILKDAGLVKKVSSGRLALTEPHLTVSGPEKASAVRKFQKRALHLAGEALENIPAKERNVSTLTLSVDGECFEDLCDMAKEFRRLVQKRVDAVKRPDRVMQFSLAFYPVTVTRGK